MSKRNAALVGFLLMGLAIGITASGLATAPPQAACGVCTEVLDRTAADQGVTLTRGNSKQVIEVYENTSTRWTATVRLTDGADALRNASLRRSIVSKTLARARMVAEPTHVSSQLSGETLTVSYRDPDAAETDGDAIVFTRFHATSPQDPSVMGGEGTPYLGANTVELRAPSGYTVAGNYTSATESETTVRWRAINTNGQIDRSTRVTFVDDQLPPDSNDTTSVDVLSVTWDTVRRHPVAVVLGVVLTAVLSAYVYSLSWD